MKNTNNKREKAEIQTQVDELVKSDKRISQLLTIKKDETSALVMDLNALEERLRIQELTGDLPTLSPRVVEDKGSASQYFIARNSLQKEISSESAEENTSLTNQIATTNASLEVLKLKMQEANPEELEKLAEEFQSLEAKLERDQSELIKISQDTSSKVGNDLISSNSGSTQQNNTKADISPKGNSETNLANEQEGNIAVDNTTEVISGKTETKPTDGVS